MSSPLDMSFSSSLLDSSASSGVVLSASTWNRQKDETPVQGKPGIGRIWGSTEDSTTEEHRHLLQKRIYPAFAAAETTHVDHAKTELEAAVLLDCLSNNFLFAHLSPQEPQALLPLFEKLQVRKNEVIVRQGDPPDFFYMLFQGEVQMQTNGEILQSEEKYTVFGELALLTGAPHSVTVKAVSGPCVLFRLDRAHFQRILLQPNIGRPTASKEEQFQVLKDAIPFELTQYLQDDDIALQKLVSGMSTRTFSKDQILFEKGQRIHDFVIITKGQVIMKDVEMGGRSYQDMPIGPGQSQTSFGWLTLEEDEPLDGTIVSTSAGTCLVIPKHVFLNALGGDHAKCGKTTLQHIVQKHLARIELQQIALFQDSALDTVQINGLLDLMHHNEYTDQQIVIERGEKVEPALYFVREGSVTLETKDQPTVTIDAGGYFGEKNMLLDQNKDGKKHHKMRYPSKVQAHGTPTRMDVLYLEECRKVVDTTLLGLGQKSTAPNAIDASLRWNDLTRHALLGSGSFGQVWLASTTTSNNKQSTDNYEHETQPQIVALKVQAKHQLIQSEDQAQRVVCERNIMASLQSPFLIRLYHAFQDQHRLYMVTSLLQGGELESLIPEEGLSEDKAKFYAAGILEGLTYMHRHHILHRDVKTMNVLLNEKGYPVLIDLGFAKYVADKTFTFCGSAMYTAPEIIRYNGHDKGCDHWSWAVLVYRLVTGKYPFYKKGMDELTLYKQICKGTFELDGQMSVEFRMLMVAILYPDPTQRLGSRVNGWRDIFASPWFATVDLPKLRKQLLPAPWVPDLKDPLDASRFHHNASEVDDLMEQTRFPLSVTESQQHIFSNFGPGIH